MVRTEFQVDQRPVDFSRVRVVYISRVSKIRGIENEPRLIETIERAVGKENLVVFRHANMTHAGIAAQIELFRHAQIIIGRHLRNEIPT